MLTALLLSALVLRDPVPAVTPTFPHVRLMSSVTHTIVDDAVRRSPTIANMMREIEQTDVIAFIELTYGTSHAQGTTKLIGVSDYARFVSVNVDFTLDQGRRMELLAHELCHVLEIAHAPEVRDDAGMQALFGRIGWSMVEKSFETAAAMDVEAMVRRDLGRPAPKPLQAGKKNAPHL
jgi:hypothetical protein